MYLIIFAPNRTGNPEISPDSYSHVILDEGAKNVY
jgi:hypothetical protein